MSAERGASSAPRQFVKFVDRSMSQNRLSQHLLLLGAVRETPSHPAVGPVGSGAERAGPVVHGMDMSKAKRTHTMTKAAPDHQRRTAMTDYARQVVIKTLSALLADALRHLVAEIWP
jgi:hypothetical protein